MPANTTPIFTKQPDVQWGAGVITAANTAMDGTGTVTTIHTAPADGSYVRSVEFRPAGTNVATVARIWLNNGSANSTPANNTLLAEVSLPATTGSNTNALAPVSAGLNIAIPNGYKLNVTLGTAIAAGVHATAIGGAF